jgi:hypothetical protein
MDHIGNSAAGGAVVQQSFDAVARADRNGAFDHEQLSSAAGHRNAIYDRP